MTTGMWVALGLFLMVIGMLYGLAKAVGKGPKPPEDHESKGYDDDDDDWPRD